MSAAGTPVCAEAIGDETLAFWRDGFLRDAGTARRLDAHTPGCASCQRRLAAMESFGAAVRRQRIPAPDPLLWRRLEARMAGGSSRASLLFGMNARTFTVGAMVSAIGAVAAVVLIAVSFLTLFSTVRPPGAPSDIFTRQASATAIRERLPSTGARAAFRRISPPSRSSHRSLWRPATAVSPIPACSHPSAVGHAQRSGARMTARPPGRAWGPCRLPAATCCVVTCCWMRASQPSRSPR